MPSTSWWEPSPLKARFWTAIPRVEGAAITSLSGDTVSGNDGDCMPNQALAGVDPWHSNCAPLLLQWHSFGGAFFDSNRAHWRFQLGESKRMRMKLVVFLLPCLVWVRSNVVVSIFNNLVTSLTSSMTAVGNGLDRISHVHAVVSMRISRMYFGDWYFYISQMK